MDGGHMDRAAIRVTQGLLVDRPSPDDEDFGRILAGPQGILEISGRSRPFGGFPILASGEYHIEASWQGMEFFGNGIPSLASHDDGVSALPLGDFLEVGHVRRKIPGQLALPTDSPRAVDGDHDGKRFQTATSNLMKG